MNESEHEDRCVFIVAQWLADSAVTLCGLPASLRRLRDGRAVWICDEHWTRMTEDPGWRVVEASGRLTVEVGGWPEEHLATSANGGPGERTE